MYKWIKFRTLRSVTAYVEGVRNVRTCELALFWFN